MNSQRRKRNIIIIFILLGALVTALIVQRYIASRGLSDYPVGSVGAEIRIVVTKGESGTAIAQDLAKRHVIVNATTLINKMIQRNIIGIAPGIHMIHTVIPSDQAIVELLDQKRISDVVLVLPGSSTVDVLRKLHLLTSLNQSDRIGSLTPIFANPSNSIEGQLAPDQYSFAPGTTTHDALADMLQTFSNQRSISGLDAGYSGFTPYNILTIASMIQIEADPIDYPKVARVIYNRLKIGMPLQLNSTVQYALGLRGQIGLSTKSTKIDSPYNTYIHVGLPPTPISNPSLGAISGALNPVAGNWLYFITVSPHDTRFTNDFNAFEKWFILYKTNLAAGAFK